MSPAFLGSRTVDRDGALYEAILQGQPQPVSCLAVPKAEGGELRGDLDLEGQAKPDRG
jgi:hypothetical protein